MRRLRRRDAQAAQDALAQARVAPPAACLGDRERHDEREQDADADQLLERGAAAEDVHEVTLVCAAEDGTRQRQRVHQRGSRGRSAGCSNGVCSLGSV
jgi:hypothetical protein